VASKKIGLKVNACKSKYIVMCRVQTAGGSDNTKIDNISFDMVEVFKYLGTTLTKHNSIQ
jgi:hypothetical protein